MTSTLDKEEIKEIARIVADEVMSRLQAKGQYIRTKRIPAEYDISRSYAEKLVKDMRESGRYADDFIKADRVVLVKRDSLERFWKERSAS